MPTIEKTTKLFMETVLEAVPAVDLRVERSVTEFGRSNYVYIRIKADQDTQYLKVRISDHAVGRNRAATGDEDLFLDAQARPEQWSDWLGEIRSQLT